MNLLRGILGLLSNLGLFAIIALLGTNTRFSIAYSASRRPSPARTRVTSGG